MSIRIKISWFEYHQSVLCAVLRIVEVTKKKKVTLFEPEYGDEQNKVQSAAAEIAVAKALNQYWGAGVTQGDQADVGSNIEVRWTRHENGKLMIRPKDKDDRPYILVRGIAPDFEIVGWIYGREGKQDCWKRDPDGKGPVYMVPEEALKSLEDAEDDGKASDAASEVSIQQGRTFGLG